MALSYKLLCQAMILPPSPSPHLSLKIWGPSFVCLFLRVGYIGYWVGTPGKSTAGTGPA